MKHILCAVLTIVALLGLTALTSCGEPNVPTPPAGTTLTFFDGDITEYRLVYAADSTSAQKRANEVISLLSMLTGMSRTELNKLKSTDDSSDTVYEILIGECDRDLSRRQARYVGQQTEDFLWSIATDGSRLSLQANSEIAWQRLYDDLTKMARGNVLAMRSNQMTKGEYTLEAYEADQIAREEALLQAEREALSEKIPALLELLRQFDIAEDFGGTAITAMPTNVWDAPTSSPTEGQHPRLFFTKDDIPAIRKTLREDTERMNQLKSQVTRNIQYGVLPTATIRSNGVYNYDANMLAAIQAKALYYQLTGIEYYGYEAILSMKNYIKTLGIGYFNSDQCRYFGNTVYIAACVYDWCYDLMSEEDKLQLQVGVENKLLKGTSGCTYLDSKGVEKWCDGYTVEGGPHAQANRSKMEIGFPPSHAGALFGHNSEYQLLRDYMSFAAAIYDEEPTWWQYCGGRFFEQYYPAREYFYGEESGIYPEGTACYAPWRFVCDMYSAWMLYSMTGENIYGDKLARVPYSFLAHETLDGAAFATGDGNGHSISTTWGSGFLMVAYLCEDPVLYANADEFGVGLYVAEQVILRGKGIASAQDRTEGFASVHYNGGHYGQLIVRRSWEDEDRNMPIVLMKGAGRINGGHDHNDFGTFQIYYKGFLTTEDGVYDTWGSTHHFFYHVATAAHNSVLIFDEAVRPHNNYNGGQRHLMSSGRPNGRETVEAWLNTAYQMGEQTGLASGADENGKTVFAYYQNDLTSAYYSNVVEYYNRTMLAVYTEDEDIPMFFFVYDHIRAKKATAQKTFLLQCVSAPEINASAGTVTVVNEGGKLVLKNLTGGKINAYGGYSGDAEQRFWLSGIDKNLPSGGGLSSGGAGNNSTTWGHVEIQHALGQQTDHMLNVLYVTDADKNPTPTLFKLESDGAIGAVADKTVAVFAKADTAVDELTFSHTGLALKRDYYVGGLADGTWRVSVGGQTVGEFVVGEGEQMLTFSANVASGAQIRLVRMR